MFSICQSQLVSKSISISRLLPNFASKKVSQIQVCHLSSEDGPKKTCLYDFHLSRSGKMVDFAGYLMPVQYGKEGIATSHIHTRYLIYRSYPEMFWKPLIIITKLWSQTLIFSNHIFWHLSKFKMTQPWIIATKLKLISFLSQISWAQSYKTFRRLLRRLTLLTWLS